MARSSRLESGFQDELKEELEMMFPGCMVFKMDQWQGLPDLLILHGDTWASLECKKDSRSHRQPNQDDYVDLMNYMSFSRFISRENKDEVLYELRDYFYLKEREE